VCLLPLFDYVYRLKFEDEPSYQWIQEEFERMLKTRGLEADGVYDWHEYTEVSPPLKQLCRPRDKEFRNQIRNLKSRTLHNCLLILFLYIRWTQRR